MVTNRRTLVWRAESPRKSRYGSQYSQYSHYSRYSQDYYHRRHYGRDRYTPYPSRYDRRQPPRTRQYRRQRALTPEEIRRARAEGYGRLYIQKQIRNRTPMVFEMYDGTLEGIILHRMPYNLVIRTGRERKIINKLDIKYCFKKKVREKIQPYLSIDEELRAKNLKPIEDPSKRYHIENRLLLECYRNRHPVTVTMRGGERISGIVDWYSQYEIKLELRKRTGILVFRHAIYDFEVHRAAVL